MRTSLLKATLTVAALSFLAAAAHAEVGVVVEIGTPAYQQAPVYQSPRPPVYYRQAPVYQAPPPVYYQPAPPPPVYYQPAPPPVIYAPQPSHGASMHIESRQQRPKLNDFQNRALDNCSLLAPKEQPQCRRTVMSTVR